MCWSDSGRDTASVGSVEAAGDAVRLRQKEARGLRKHTRHLPSHTPASGNHNKNIRNGKNFKRIDTKSQHNEIMAHCWMAHG